MSLLQDAIKKIISTNTSLGAKSKIVSIPCGIDILDLSNGAIDPENGNIDIGQREGHIIGFAGHTGSGKSTVAQQMAYGMVKPFKNGSVIVYDIEKSYSSPRMKNLYTMGDASQIKDFDEKVGAPYNIDTNLDNLRVLLTLIGKEKTANKDKYIEKFIDANGKEVEVLAPTIVIVDSIAGLFSEARLEKAEGTGVKIEETAEGETNMAGSQAAIENNNLFAKYLNVLFKNNIYLFVIGHITTNVQTGRTPKPSKIPWLAPDENIKGGTGFWYFSDYFVRINKGDLLKEEKDYGIHGFINRFQVLKSRGNSSGLVYPLVFDLRRGYNNTLSNVQFLIEQGEIATGTRSYLKSLPDIKFTKSTVLQVCEEHPELVEAFSNRVAEIFMEKMPTLDKDGNGLDENLSPEEKAEALAAAADGDSEAEAMAATSVVAEKASPLIRRRSTK